MALYVGLCHYPVYDKNKKVICSAITSMDIHDLARLSMTFGVSRCFIMNPLRDQLELARNIVEHWIVGHGASYNPHRRRAFETIRVCEGIEDAIHEIKGETGQDPLLIATDASPKGRMLTYGEVRDLIREKIVLLIFGTAWGLYEGVIEASYGLLEPIYGVGDYNHLSVRAAAAIILDRLMMRK